MGLVKAGFDEFGYNRVARNFVGTGASWCADYGVLDETICNSWLGGPFFNDKLVMKWNAEWDRGNDEGWSNGPYRAWLDNEWNGMKGGSGSVWHYKIKWIGECTEKEIQPDGGYCIWGQFEVLMDQGTDKTGNLYPTFGYPCEGESNNGGHKFCGFAIPNGYGVKP